MHTSHISKKELKSWETIKGHEIRKGVFALIQKNHPDFNEDSVISIDELNQYRRLYLTDIVEQEKGDLSKIDQDVLKSVNDNTYLSENLELDMDSKLTLGQKIADKIAVFGGSWTFIISFFSVLLLWMLTNVVILTAKPFDPYPFILLNLVLSCLAAIQAPIIMMSQNRQEQKDRQRAEHDYKINLKAEMEIKLLNEKIDYLMVNQNKKLVEIQEMQIDYLEDLMREIRSK